MRTATDVDTPFQLIRPDAPRGRLPSLLASIGIESVALTALALFTLGETKPPAITSAPSVLISPPRPIVPTHRPAREPTPHRASGTANEGSHSRFEAPAPLPMPLRDTAPGADESIWRINPTVPRDFFDPSAVVPGAPSSAGAGTPSSGNRTPAESMPVNVGGRVQPPQKIHHVEPVYPRVAIEAGLEGLVLLETTIGIDGRVSQVRVLRSVPLLEKAAVDAVSQWRYEPTLLNGTPVSVIMTVTVRFVL